jgi:hypothetical protein
VIWRWDRCHSIATRKCEILLSFYRLGSYFLSGQTRYVSHTIHNPFCNAEVEASTVHIATRENPIVNRLNKTKVERQVDHEQERVDRIKKEGAIKRAAAAQKVLSFHLLSRLIQYIYIHSRNSKRQKSQGRGRQTKLLGPTTS